MQSQNTVISQSKFELSRDAVMVLIKDRSKTLREDLTEEELEKYADSAYRGHIKSKKEEKSGTQSKNYDSLYEASKNRGQGKSTWGANRGPEVGVSIQVGIQQPVAADGGN